LSIQQISCAHAGVQDSQNSHYSHEESKSYHGQKQLVMYDVMYAHNEEESKLGITQIRWKNADNPKNVPVT
jgi:hypothetical protein